VLDFSPTVEATEGQHRRQGRRRPARARSGGELGSVLGERSSAEDRSRIETRIRGARCSAIDGELGTADENGVIGVRSEVSMVLTC
jgi:hypothetical protein